MKRLLLVLVAALIPATVTAQEGAINSPITRASIAKVKISDFVCTRSPVRCTIIVFYTDSSDNEIIPEGSQNLRTTYVVPSNAGDPCTQATAYVGAAGSGVLSDAMNTARASETGTAQRRQAFRVIGYLSDRGCLPGVTVAP